MFALKPAPFIRPAHSTTGTPCVDRLVAALGDDLLAIDRMGSRVTCDPPPADTDEDWLMLVNGDPEQRMWIAGFLQDGNPEFYTGDDAGSFRSWRQDEVNVVTTPDPVFHERFMTATRLAKRFNLLKKEDRVALFQAVLYGVDVGRRENADADMPPAFLRDAAQAA